MKRKVLEGQTRKKPRKSQSEVYLTNVKHFGPEPKYDGSVLGMSQKARSLAWYANMCDVSDAKEYAENYAARKLPHLVEGLRSVPDTSFPLSASWLARMADLGAHTEDETFRFIERSFTEAVRKYSGRADEKVDIEYVSSA